MCTHPHPHKTTCCLRCDQFAIVHKTYTSGPISMFLYSLLILILFLQCYLASSHMRSAYILLNVKRQPLAGAPCRINWSSIVKRCSIYTIDSPSFNRKAQMPSALAEKLLSADLFCCMHIHINKQPLDGPPCSFNWGPTAKRCSIYTVESSSFNREALLLVLQLSFLLNGNSHLLARSYIISFIVFLIFYFLQAKVVGHNQFFGLSFQTLNFLEKLQLHCKYINYGMICK